MYFLNGTKTPGSVDDFLLWAEEHLAEQREELRVRYTPVLRGLMAVAVGQREARAVLLDVYRLA